MPADTTKYVKVILRIFALTFPGAVFFKVKGKEIKIDNWHELLPLVYTNSEDKNNFLKALSLLENEGTIRVRWKPYRRGREWLALSLEDPRRMYSLLLENGGDSKTGFRERITEWEPINVYGNAVREYLLEKIDRNEPIPFTTCEEFNACARIFDWSAARLFEGIDTDREEIRTNIGIADDLLRKVLGVSLSEKLGLSRLFPAVLCSLYGDFRFSEDAFLNCNGEILSLPLSLVSSMQSFECAHPKKIISVQRKEMFYIINRRHGGEGTGFIWTGEITDPRGSGSAVHRMLQLIAESDPAVQHFGNIDPEGFVAFKAVQEAIPRDVHPVGMDAETYRNNLSYGYKLRNEDMLRLREMDGAEFGSNRSWFETLRGEIVKEQMGLSQEFIRLELP